VTDERMNNFMAIARKCGVDVVAKERDFGY
jgi:hypothetical protein